MHREAMDWMNRLVIDLKKQLLGYPVSEPITMERLQEWSRLYNDLDQCRQPARVY